ncbi:hypothetical protein ASJ35_06620 [Ruthenibacterium lactatiformans]|uniref:DUF4315 family protein n=1 Tax=Ruthenibacterium lactatiformans TaxID=1550024 RepID=A0A0W7TS65_9FIRM|nr:DUF4315 family protein [Ruthenibacterium lactatiformans]KUE76680.1 hypothetical protein ASJ35_06620 [Ruthenibacterium lactatiformans]
MNAKINKLRGELTKNKNKISELQSRNREIERQITELENNDILELVHSHDLDITQLSALIQAMKTDPASVMRGEMEESDHEEN